MEIPLKTSFTVFLYDFRIKKSWKQYPVFQNNGSTIWKRSAVKPDAAYLFNHVQDFFLRNSGAGEIDENQCVIFEINRDKPKDALKQKLFLFNNFFARAHCLMAKDDGEANIPFKVISDASVLSPKIFICPLTSVGILIYTLQIGEKDNTLKNLIHLNYHSRIFSSGQVAGVQTPKNPHPGAAEQENRISGYLNEFGKKEKSNENISGTPAEPGIHEWTLRTLVNYFLQDFEEGTIEEVSPARLQAFTFAATEKKMEKQELNFSLFRLRRMYNYNYVPGQQFLDDSEETSQTFEQVHYGASVEGAVILINEEESKLPPFLRNYSEVLKHRMIWTYLLAYHQRVALIVAADEVSALYGNNRNLAFEELTAIIKKLTLIQLKCMFTEISHYTQQNDFYYLCCRTLRLPNLFGELKNELDEMNRILTDEWRKQEEKTRMHQEIQNKKRDQRIAILVGLLVVPQVWFGLVNTFLWNNFFRNHEGSVVIITVLLFITIAIVAVKYLVVRRDKE